MRFRKKSLKEIKEDHDSRRASRPIGVEIILDNVRSGMNVGSIFRTADALGIDRIQICGISPRPPHKEILKTAIGASETVRWHYHQSTYSICENLKEHGFTLIALEQTENSTPIDSLQFLEHISKIAVILGNEVKGVDQKVLEICDVVIEIPQYGHKHSMNVAVSAGILLHHIAKLRRSV